ncbi:hypothetical protein SCOR_23190 [Sulfidibacter corallicola]
MLVFMVLMMIDCPEVVWPDFGLTCVAPCEAARPGGCAESPSVCMKKCTEWFVKVKKKYRETAANARPQCRVQLLGELYVIHEQTLEFARNCPLCFAEEVTYQQLIASFIETNKEVMNAYRELKTDQREYAVAMVKFLKRTRKGMDKLLVRFEMEGFRGQEQDYRTLLAWEQLLGELEEMWSEYLAMTN